MRGVTRDSSMDLASHHWSIWTDLNSGRRRSGAEISARSAEAAGRFRDVAYCSVDVLAFSHVLVLCQPRGVEIRTWGAPRGQALAFFRCAHSGTQAAQAAHKRPKRPTPVKSLTLTLIAQLILTLSSPRVGCCSPHALQPHHAGRMSGRLGPVRSGLAWRAQEGLRRRDARDEQLRHQRQCRRCCSCLSTCASRA